MGLRVGDSYEADAEERCERYLTEGRTWDPTNPEVYQSLASVRMSQERTAEAVELMRQNLALWMPERACTRESGVEGAGAGWR